jgi:hypothetical protein
MAADSASVADVSPILEAALRARDAGISVMPVAEDGSKAPAVGKWKQHMRVIPSEAEIRYRFATSTGLALICGRVSGGLECLDFDVRDVFDTFCEACEKAGLGELLARIMAGYHETSPRGVHLLYRCSDAKSTKLARRRLGAKIKALIETKGEGGYVITAPSHGKVHPDGVYELVTGSLESIVTLTDEEHRALHDIARALDEDLPLEEERREPAPSVDSWSDRPGDEYARTTSWADILEPHGWRHLWTRNERTFWRRPGKSKGISATTNYADSNLFYSFSTSTEFEANRGYGKFSAYALLEHRGDFRAAASCLRDQGFGTSRPVIEDVDVSALMERTEKRKKAAAASSFGAFPEHLFAVPGLVGQLSSFLYEEATHPQRVLSLASAIASCGTLFGRRVTMLGVCPNIAVIALAMTGSGKEWTRSGARKAFRAAKLESLLSVDSVTSASAIHAVLRRTPSVLLSFDEFGRMISQLKRWDSHGIIEEIMSVYGRSSDVTWSKSYAGSRNGKDDGAATCVWLPHLSLYACSVPVRFWDSLSDEDALDGFLNRFLIFVSEDPNPYPRMRLQVVPESLIAALAAWHPMHDLAYQASLGDPDQPPPPAHELEVTAAAGREIQRLTDDLHQRVSRAYAANDSGRAAALKRTREHALKLTLIRASGRMAPGAFGAVDVDDVLWGAEVATWCSDYALACINARVASTERDRDCKRVMAWVHEQGGAVKRSEVTGRWQRVRDLKDVLRTLLDSEQLIEAKPKASGGRPAVWLCTPEAAERLYKEPQGVGVSDE